MNEAIKFSDWLKERYKPTLFNGWRDKNTGYCYQSAELYKLFNPSGAARQADCPTGEDGDLNCPVLDAVYEGAAQWEERCRSAENALKALVNLKDWKEKSGKDSAYLAQQPLAWAAAPPPPAAGPVWVKANTIDIRPIRYYAKWGDFNGSGIFMTDVNVKHFYFDRFGLRPISEKYFDKLLILDESTPVQQVFSREQVPAIFEAYSHYRNDAGELEFKEWFNTNYPPINK